MTEIDFTPSKFHEMSGEEAYAAVTRKDKTIRIAALVVVVVMAVVAAFSGNALVLLGCAMFMFLAAWLSTNMQQQNIREVLQISAQDCTPDKAATVWGLFSAKAKKDNIKNAYAILQASDLASAGMFAESKKLLDQLDSKASQQNKFIVLTTRFKATLYTKGCNAAKPLLDEITEYQLTTKHAKSQNSQIAVMAAYCSARYALEKRDEKTAAEEIALYEQHVSTPGAYVTLQVMQGKLNELQGKAESAQEHYRQAVEHGGTTYDKKMAQKRLEALGKTEPAEQAAEDAIADDSATTTDGH